MVSSSTTRRAQPSRPAAWEILLALAGCSLVTGLLVRVVYLLDLLLTGVPASLGPTHQALIVLEGLKGKPGTLICQDYQSKRLEGLRQDILGYCQSKWKRI